MLTLFSSRHIGVPLWNTNMAAPCILGSVNLRGTVILTNIFTLGQRTHLKLGELSSFLSSIISKLVS